MDYSALGKPIRLATLPLQSGVDNHINTYTDVVISYIVKFSDDVVPRVSVLIFLNYSVISLRSPPSRLLVTEGIDGVVPWEHLIILIFFC